MYDVNDARVQSYAGEGLFNRKLTYQGKTYAEYSAPTTLSYKYIYGNNEKLTRVSGSGTKTSFHHDYLGSVRRMTDASGALLWSRDYYPFGHERESSGASNLYKFTGKDFAPETGLYYIWHRYYRSIAEIRRLPDDPITGRFTQVDPKWKVYAGLSPYQYAANNPLRNIDPDGRYILDAQLARNTRVVNLFKELQWFAHATPSVHAAFGQLNTKVSDFADFGVGPKVTSAKMILRAGHYPKRPTSDLQTITLNEALIEKLTKANTPGEIRFWKSIIVWTVLHETGHWAWLTKKMGIEKKEGVQELPNEPAELMSEVGDWIETQIWGENRTWDTTVEFDPENDQLWDFWDASSR